MKRLMDLTCAAIGLAVLWPLFLLVAILIKRDGGGPVFFKQERIGRGFRPFMMYKFRTMVTDAERLGALLTARNDRRITRIGAFLRRTKLDELPQLINVFRGEMSLVGPRPEVARYVDLFREEYAEVLRVRPGITDLASLQYRDESEVLGDGDTESVYIERVLPEKLRLARDYVRRASLAYDLRLVVTTLAYLFYPAQAVERIIDRLSPYRFWLGMLLQTVVLVAANALAFAIRFDGHVPANENWVFLRALPVVLLAQLVWLYRFRLFHSVWRYAGVTDLLNIATALTLGSLTSWLAIRWVLGITSYSRGILFIHWLLSVALLGGIRIARRCHRELRTGAWATHKVLLVGGEDQMERVVRELVDRNGHNTRVIGMLNGDARKKGMRIHGVPVLGTYADLVEVVRGDEPDEVLIAMPAASAEARAAVLRQCRSLGKRVRSVPDVSDLIHSREKPRLSDSFSPNDLLFREPIGSDVERAEAVIRGKRIMITGAGGSIGSEIARQVAASHPESLVLFERHEFALYEIDRELRRRHPALTIEPVIGDVADELRVAGVMAATRPQLIFHAAAYKHVPMMERNPGEALRTNVVGTRTVAEAAIRYEAEAFVLISTDKAVEPVSMMGISKRMAELVMQLMSRGSHTKILTVRFGNVLGSSGSVVPLFREQIERGGPVTVTHPDVTRLFMTIPEAVHLILEAAGLGQTGDLYVLDMGKPIRIIDLARALIRLYGLAPGKDIQIVTTGLRPGERLFEKLLSDDETVWKTAHPKLLRAVSRASLSQQREELARLIGVAEERMGNPAGDVRRLAQNLSA
jgi:FlaA1/EpsC-like NDP-sugar epimerase/lipopolysaccharide/colanic/teichoic acid biosynthesis glycosyltransferase